VRPPRIVKELHTYFVMLFRSPDSAGSCTRSWTATVQDTSFE